MKIAMIAHYDHHTYPGFIHLAVKLAGIGADVYYITKSELGSEFSGVPRLQPRRFSIPLDFKRHFPWYRSGSDAVFATLKEINPHFIISQNEYVLPALIYKSLFKRDVVMGHSSYDNERKRRYVKVAAHLSHLIDIQLECCDVLCRFRQQDWPKMNAKSFILRHAPPFREEAVFLQHQGPARVVFTSSKYVLGLNRERLTRFIGRLCSHGVSVDWYFPHQDENREIARSLLSHPLYAVRERIEKAQLLDTLSRYDVGLHWAPMAEQNYDYNYFQSTASNKIGEYVAAGLAVAYAGNPGLAFLPREISLVYDPTDPEVGADQLAAALADRAALERMRAASLRYHQQELNSDAQAAPFTRYVLQIGSSKAE